MKLELIIEFDMGTCRIEPVDNFFGKNCYRVLGTQNRLFITGGERGIRTLETLLSTRFPGVRLKPLGHPSGDAL